MEMIMVKEDKDFIAFLLKCEGVVLFRSSPAQKSKVVEFVKKNDPTKKTLAIGDGIKVYTISFYVNRFQFDVITD